MPTNVWGLLYRSTLPSWWPWPFGKQPGGGMSVSIDCHADVGHKCGEGQQSDHKGNNLPGSRRLFWFPWVEVYKMETPESTSINSDFISRVEFLMNFLLVSFNKQPTPTSSVLQLRGITLMVAFCDRFEKSLFRVLTTWPFGRQQMAGSWWLAAP